MWVTLILLLIFFAVCLSQSRADWGGIHVNWLDGFTRILCKVLHRHPGLVLPLPDHGHAIVAANHVSGLDPLLLIAE
jgi:1-acyl-sn-glycerol-3-phosphate acyltransferase